LHVAVTGMNAGDSPAPGVGVARCIRESNPDSIKIIGLGYDALDSGILDPHLAQCSYLLPYPRDGRASLLRRLIEIHERERIDVLIPCLDAELPNFIALEPQLLELGIRVFLPTAEQFRLREKQNLSEFSKASGVRVPETLQVHDPLDARIQSMNFPVMVKGIFYDAYHARSAQEASHFVTKIAQVWGYPVLIQQFVSGEEYNAAILGDGSGAVVSSASMKKLVLTEKRKGWACVSIENPELTALAEKIVSALKWRGPMEVEAIYSEEDRCFYLIELNPRFPAWIYLAKAAGVDLPTECLKLARGEPPARQSSYRSGVVISNYTTNLVVKLDEIKTLFTDGELQNDKLVSKTKPIAAAGGAQQ